MTKEVMVTIAGLQAIGEDSEDQDAIELVHIGEYYKKNGNHYILFDEMMEGMAEPVRNIIKIKDRRFCLPVPGGRSRCCKNWGFPGTR